MRTEEGKPWSLRYLCDSSAGFTITELLVAGAMSSILMAAVIGHVFIVRNGYFDDIVRTKINSNLRSAMDIVSMNIRQAGENLESGFPAIEVVDGDEDVSDILILRRALRSEVLTLCVEAHAGTTTLEVSSAAVGTGDCTASNVMHVHRVFEEFREQDPDSEVRAYIYNRISGQGEFVDYTDGGESGDEYYLTTSALKNDYDARTTYIYLLEEYRFERDLIEDVFVLTINGRTEEPQTVAFAVTDIEIALRMSDGSTISELNSQSSMSWRDIRRVSVTLSGEEQRRERTLRGSITAEYFPRNVLSY